MSWLPRLLPWLLPALLFSGCHSPPPSPSEAELQRIAVLIYRNECASDPQYLTSWNRGEEFASLGIGHFIWYPAAIPPAQRRFHESFPELVAYLRQHGTALPSWLTGDAPWPDRASFHSDIASGRMHQLRQLLQTTMPLQARFMQERMQHALSAMQSGLPEAQQAHLQRQFERIAASPMGYYALIDYVNFKGEGISPQERYQGKGWGLRQVLLSIQGNTPGLDAIKAFADAAAQILARRVLLAPPERQEQRWLPGWSRRVQSYVREAASAVKASEPALPSSG